MMMLIPIDSDKDVSLPAESGSLCIDIETGDAYGIVIASSATPPVTYAMPLEDIFENIKSRWNVTTVEFLDHTNEKFESAPLQ